MPLIDDDSPRPLRDDVRLLGDQLGATLRAQEGEPLYELVERVRALSKAGRQDPDQPDDPDLVALAELVSGLDLDELVPMVRAFAHFLTLANIAEQHHRIRRQRSHGQKDVVAQPGSTRATFERLLARGVPPEKLRNTVTSLSIELVLTAHPTEVVRRHLRRKHLRIAELLERGDSPGLTEHESAERLQELARVVTAGWATDEVRRNRPTPLDEAEWGLVIFEQTLWDVLPRYLRVLDRRLHQFTGRGLPDDAAPIRFGSWMGGDRDGNPNVTPKISERACMLARWMACDLYAKELDALRAELTMSRASDELRARYPDAREPYRRLLADLRERLLATRRHLELVLTDHAPFDRAMLLGHELLRDELDLCRRSLEASGLGLVAAGRLLDLRRRLATFGMTLVRLDLRQESDRHTAALDVVTRALGVGSYAQWSEDERLTFLRHELAGPRPLVPPSLLDDPSVDAEVRDVLATFRAAARIPRDALGAYVISMARAASDVLAVELLQKDAGISPPLRTVPLFETRDDLRAAGDVVRSLLEDDAYRRHLRRHHGHIELMLGYSDSSKDAGRMAAAWELYQAQEALVKVCAAADIPLTLFHGRGGTVSRGGGPLELAILGQPPGSVAGTLRVTEQGEMIQEKLAVPGIALGNLETYVSATLEASLTPPEPPPAAWRERMTTLADTAATAYQTTVRDPRFVAYFRAATPEVELGGLNIASRPARRRPEGGVESLRAIPWVFSWMQSRLMLPSWLGAGEALTAAIEAGDLDELRAMYREWPFFASLIELLEMVVAKTAPTIAEQYDRYLVPEPLREIGIELRQRLQQTRQALLDVTGHADLLENNPVLRRSIEVRNPYVDPINLAQVQILRRLRDEHGQRADYPRAIADSPLFQALVRTINGIAAGMRNTG